MLHSQNWNLGVYWSDCIGRIGLRQPQSNFIDGHGRQMQAASARVGVKRSCCSIASSQSLEPRNYWNKVTERNWWNCWRTIIYCNQNCSKTIHMCGLSLLSRGCMQKLINHNWQAGLQFSSLAFQFDWPRYLRIVFKLASISFKSSPKMQKQHELNTKQTLRLKCNTTYLILVRKHILDQNCFMPSPHYCPLNLLLAPSGCRHPKHILQEAFHQT